MTKMRPCYMQIQSFCKDLSIPNLEDALGRNINDVIRDIGAKIHSMEDNSSSLKMMDVLKKWRRGD